ncbi:DUF1456 family protein [Peribacillus acanthi]|uniref:DUF1456 family protein n=1 Tax=Peribacillus acanthi TaxID=2171554 RepID=UPI000D3E9EC6|nr:DUF1456 family protein [Peribacillus acanthi]
MDNNDILIRLRYALDLKNIEMVEIFKLGGFEVAREELPKILTKTKDSDDEDENLAESEDNIKCNNMMLDSFLNGLITFKRGKQEGQPGQATTPDPSINKKPNMNNNMLKKVKIALQLTSEDMLEILEDGGIMVSKGELGALLRKEGHKNYKECGDNFARKFLRGLTVRYRG